MIEYISKNFYEMIFIWTSQQFNYRLKYQRCELECKKYKELMGYNFGESVCVRDYGYANIIKFIGHFET